CAFRHRRAYELLGRGLDRLQVLAGSEPDREACMCLDDERGIHEVGFSSVDAVHVERRLGPRACIELGSRVRIEWRSAGLTEQDAAARKDLRSMLLIRSELSSTCAQLISKEPVLRDERGQDLHQDVDRVQRRAAVDPRMQVAGTGPDADVETDETARREAELGLLRARDVPV